MMTKAPPAGKRFKILHIVSSAQLAGTERALLMLIDGSDRARFEHIVALPEDGALVGELSRRGIQAVTMPRGRFSPAFHLRFAALLFRLRPQILHIHGSRLHAIPARLLGIRTIERKNLTRETFHKTRSINPAYDRLGNLFIQMMITPSDYLRDYYLARGISGPDRIVTVHNGIELEPFDAPLDLDSKLREFGLEARNEPICAVGRLVPLKGTDDLLSAMPLILMKRPSVRLLLVGDGPERAALERQAEALGIEGSVSFLGARGDVASILRVCRVFVHPSHTEALSNAVLEAMAARCPVAASDIPGNRVVVRHGDTGLLFAPGNSAAIAAAVCRLLEDRELAAALALKARPVIETRFRKEVMASETEKLYLRLLGL